MKDITNIIQTLHKANMKISEEKSHFFQKQTEFLDPVITSFAHVYSYISEVKMVTLQIIKVTQK